MWLDHRAEEEAAFINQTNHTLLRYVGGAVSLEMEMPKILWLKNKVGGLLPCAVDYKRIVANAIQKEGLCCQ